MFERKTNLTTGVGIEYGIEYADGERRWYEDAHLRDAAYERDASLAACYPKDDVMPVAKLKREVTTTLVITRENAVSLAAQEAQ